ncbi:DNA-directed RNA polymerase III subunit RPC9-like [Galendromus occidentalis]|uniref:DNA-directed RNA polymerase III subunit RPC9 n=1 Tax=Galendromus occidentalis TaxID=34638 RepID=A0AAJ6VYT5_9ACAR|nr:DNA-directed RNA polymerase III subunit RPC9-like [Galendromus occidentalis]
MSVINAMSHLLSNFEVMSILKKSQAEVRACKSLATLSYETLKHLVNSPASKQSEEVVLNFLQEMKNFPKPLTKAEKLQLLNLRPTNFAEIQVIIENMEERLSEAELEDLLQLVARTIPSLEEEESPPEATDLATVEN